MRNPERNPERNLKIGAIGLGIGTIAAYGKAGDEIRFYEINSQVEELARKYFSYLSDSAAQIDVVIGDGRVLLARELEKSGSQQFDVLVVDAFSGDAIPIHLLTREAVELYWQHLKEDGVLALHLSNFHLDLLRIARPLAAHTGHDAVWIEDGGGGNYYEKPNDWVLITRNQHFLEDRRVHSAKSDWDRSKAPVVWTDDFSNLLEVLHWD